LEWFDFRREVFMPIAKMTNLFVACLLTSTLIACAKKSDGDNNAAAPANQATTPLTNCPAGQSLQNINNVATCIPDNVVNPNGVINCQSNYVQNPMYGCIPQNTQYCPQGFGYHQNSCFPPPALNYPQQNNYSCTGGCGAGQVQTMYGCLPQCSECGGMINGACIPGYGTFQGQYGVHQGYPYQFQGGIYFWYPNSSWNMYKTKHRRFR
jgi:hypothetical protein